MNIQNMLKQAQNMQKQMEKTQNELAQVDVTADAGNGAVSVTFDGQGKFKSIKLKAEAINPDNPSSVDEETIEMLEDLITSAITEANNKAAKLMQDKMSAVTGGIKIPGLF